MPVLRLVPLKGDAILVTDDEAIVGREPSCRVVVAHPSVSRRHAVLNRSGDAFSVEDQGSANGTFVNAKRIVTSALKAGDSLRFGSATFAVEVVGDAEMVAIDEEELQPEQTMIVGPQNFSQTVLGGAPVVVEPTVAEGDATRAMPAPPMPSPGDGDATRAMPAPPVASAPPPPSAPPSQPPRGASWPPRAGTGPRPWSAAPPSLRSIQTKPRPATMPPSARPAPPPPPQPPLPPTAVMPVLAEAEAPAAAKPQGFMAQFQNKSPMFWAAVGGAGCLVVALLTTAIVLGVVWLTKR